MLNSRNIHVDQRLSIVGAMNVLHCTVNGNRLSYIGFKQLACLNLGSAFK